MSNDQVKSIKDSEDLLACTLLYTGIRRNEALALELEDIDFKCDRIKIYKQILWETGCSPKIINNTKTSKGIRTVPLLKPLKDIFQKSNLTPGLIFHKNGKLLSEGEFSRRWTSFKAQIGSNITPHQFRHTYITMLWGAGIDMKTAQELAGHSKIELMYNIYTHLDKTASDNAKDVLNDFLAK